jgi:2-keto-4-pentenoate hydratase/2-oxohepta-3-ene-1,7-dioic acid hydratase in catechol pathway
MTIVLGYTAFNDVTARDFQFADGQWQRGKFVRYFCAMGQTIVTTDTITDPHKLSIKLVLNGQTMQDSNTDQLIFGVPALIEFLSESITLEPGDVIATGTPRVSVSRATRRCFSNRRPDGSADRRHGWVGKSGNADDIGYKNLYRKQ